LFEIDEHQSIRDGGFLNSESYGIAGFTIAGDRGFVLHELGVDLVDLGEPDAEPARVESEEIGPDLPISGKWYQDIGVEDDKLFILQSNTGLHVLRLDDSGAPIELATVDLEFDEGTLVIAGSRAYVCTFNRASGQSHMRVFGISDPGAPHLVSHLSIPCGRVFPYRDDLAVALGDGLTVVRLDEHLGPNE
jgi:hypothetical protein